MLGLATEHKTGSQEELERRERSTELNEITKRVISEATTEQLDKSFEGIVEAMSYRSTQGMGTDRTLRRWAP